MEFIVRSSLSVTSLRSYKLHSIYFRQAVWNEIHDATNITSHKALCPPPALREKYTEMRYNGLNTWLGKKGRIQNMAGKFPEKSLRMGNSNLEKEKRFSFGLCSSELDSSLATCSALTVTILQPLHAKNKLLNKCWATTNQLDLSRS
jgi:hypothetical protein